MGCAQSQIQKQCNQQYQIQVGVNEIRKVRNKNKMINARMEVSNQIFENVQKINDKSMTVSDLSLLDKTIKTHFLFCKLGNSERLQLIEEMKCYSAQTNQYIFKQGDPASMFFIIVSGSVIVQVDSLDLLAPKKVLKTMGPGEYFGELALLYSMPRSGSVKAQQKSIFWCISQKQFKEKLQSIITKNYNISRKIIDKIGIFSLLSKKQKDSIAFNMTHQKYDHGFTIFREGQIACSFYIIISGQVEINISDKQIINLKAGNTFGQNCLKPSEYRMGTVRCLGQVQCISIGKDILRSCIGKKVDMLRLYHSMKWCLLRSSLFKNSTNLLIDRLIASIEFKQYQSNHLIMEAGKQVDRFLMCLEGEIKGFSNEVLLNQEYIGKDKTLQNDIIVKQAGIVGQLKFQQIEKILGGSLQTHLNQIVLSTLQASNRQQIPNNDNIAKDKKKIVIDHYKFTHKLNQGFNSIFYSVENNNNGNYYVLRCMEKNKVIKKELEKMVLNQKDILQIVKFPLIARLEGTSKDQYFIYFLYKIQQRGDFFDLIREIDTFSIPQCQFYLGCLILTIEYLHSMNIVYRDLKPQNAIVDEYGYLNLLDFGISKMLCQEKGFRTFTIVGTPHYMAPQIIEGKGYSFSCDIWSLGVLMFEMLFGCHPYGQNEEDPFNIYKIIQNSELVFEENSVPKYVKQLIEMLLQKNPDKRAIENFDVLKTAQFFKGFDWQALISRKITPPCIPVSRKINQRLSMSTYLEAEKLKLSRPILSNLEKWEDQF